MEAGLLYTDAGPPLLFLAATLLFYTSLRNPAGAVTLFMVYVLVAPFFTYRPVLQAAGLGSALLLLGATTLSTKRPSIRFGDNPIDRAMWLFAFLMAVAALRGLLSDHSRAHWAGDVYHYLLIGPFLYLVCRRAVSADAVAPLLGRYLIAASVVAALTVTVFAVSGPRSELVWLIGSPLDEGGVRLKPDFGFPLVALLLATGRLLIRPSAAISLATALLATVLLLTFKRTFWVAAIVAALPLLVVTARLASTTLGRTIRRSTLLLFALLVAAGAMKLVGANTESLTRRGAELATPLEVETVHSRSEEWRGVLRDVRRHPFGHGLGASLSLETESGTRRTHYVHNVYLQWIVQAGILGLAAGLALLAAALFPIFRRPTDHGDHPGVTASIVGLAVAGLALLSFYTPLTGILFALQATLLDRRPAST